MYNGDTIGLIIAQILTQTLSGFISPEELPAEATLAEGRGLSVEGCRSPSP